MTPIRFCLNAGLAAVLALAAIPGAAPADTPAGGLGGLALSPGGAWLYVAGDNRTLYVLEPTKLEMKERHWLGTTVVGIDVRKDGKALILRDTSGIVRVLDTATFETLWTSGKSEASAYAPEADRLVLASYRSNETTVTVIDAATFAEISSLRLAMQVGIMGVDPGATRATLLSFSTKRESEEKAQAPANLKGIDKRLFTMDHDQRGSLIGLVDLSAGTSRVVESAYQATAARALTLVGDRTFVQTYTDDTAIVGPDGTVTLIESGASSHYAVGLSPDGTTLISGGLASITLKPLDSAAVISLKLDRLEGWPEYVLRIVPDGSGGYLAATSAWRVLRFDPQKGVTAIAPVY